MRKQVFILIAVVTFAGISWAQRTEPQEAKSQFGRRAAKIPQSDADTGVQYNEARMVAAAAQYFYDIRTSGEIKDLALIEKIGYEEFKKLRGAVALKQQSIPVWEPIGGDQGGHNSGRSRSMAFKGLNTVYVAFAQGGIWKTDNINDQQPTWVPLTDKLESIAFGAIIADPRNGDIVYAGTGESEGGFSTPPGSGLFKTTDGGLNWLKILGTDTLGTRCSEIAINPKNPDILYIATGSSKSGTSGGLIKTTDAGATWKALTLASFVPYDIEIDPEDTARIYTSGSGKIFRSINSGASWQQVTTGLPTSNVGRIELAIAPSAPNLIYASIGMSNSSRATLGLWLSTDRGDTWKTLSSTTPPTGANWHGMQQEYATGLVVHPTIPRQVFMGGLDIYRTNDSGKTYTNLSQWNIDINAPKYSHADVHGMYYTNGALYVNNDGGLSISKNSGTSFNTNVNKGIATLQFVNVDADKDFTYVIGGCQDNGTNLAFVGDKQFTETRGGDGGYVQVSQAAPNVCYSQYVYGEMFKSLSAGSNGSWQPMNPPFVNKARFYMPFDFDETGSYGLAAASSLWVTQSGGFGSGAWTEYLPKISSASAVHVFPSDPTYMWAATGSSFYRSTDAGSTFTKGTNATGASTIMGIVADPSNPLNVWICSQGTNGATPSNKHVYKSTDGGATFTALPNFPNIGCNWIARQHATGNLFVATDKGVVFTKDEGQTWFALEDGLPNVQVLSIRVRGTNQEHLLAGTYGRGMFKLDISNLTSVDEPKTAPGASVVTLEAVSPNPIRNGGGTMNFSISHNAVVTATLYDVLGRTVKTLAKSPFTEGKHSLNFTTNELPTGTYIISVAADGVAKTQRIVVE